MEHKKGEVVLFPKLKEKLRNEGLEAVREHRYEDAIPSLELLLEHEEADDEVTTGLLISWVGAGEYKKAEDVCLERMKESAGNYYQYLHIYITILFHEGKYGELMSLVDEVLEEEKVPHDVRTQLWQMHQVSKEIEENRQREEEQSLIEECRKAFDAHDVTSQWNLLHELKRHPITRYRGELEDRLSDTEVHPVIKTAILEWFIAMNEEKEVEVHKFGKAIDFSPAATSPPSTHYIVKHMELRLSSVEQSHPSMYEIISSMLHRYIYVRYPFLPKEKEVPLLIQALKAIGYEYLQLEEAPTKIEPEIESYKRDIEIANEQYRAIAGE